MGGHIFFQAIQIVLNGIYIFYFVCSCNGQYCQILSSKFLVEPTDKEVRKGGNAIFHCSVETTNPQIKSLTWKMHPKSESKSVITKTYDITKGELTTNITVQSSIIHTQHQISCILEDITEQETVCFSSRLAMMYTIYFPMQEDVNCNPLLLEEFQSGDTLSLSCRVPRGNPPVDISWILLPSKQKLSPSLVDDGTSRVLSHELIITPNLHSSTVLCKITSKFYFPGERLQCLVGPIKVFHPPEVRIYPQYTSMSGHEEIELICTAAAYPEVQNFTWHCSPEGVLEGCGQTSSTRHRLHLNKTNWCMSKIEGVYVSCSAANSQGIGEGFAYVDIIANANTCRNSNRTDEQEQNLESGLDVNITMYQELSADGFALACFISGYNNTVHSADFQWHLGNVTINDNDIFHTETKGQMSLLTFSMNIVTKDLQAIISCESTINNVTTTAYANISAPLKNKHAFWSAPGNFSTTAKGQYDNASAIDQMTEYTTDIITLATIPNFNVRVIVTPFILMIFSGSALFVTIILIVIWVCLCKFNRKPQKQNKSSSYQLTGNAQPMISPATADHSTNIETVDDSYYEVPNNPSRTQSASYDYDLHSSSCSSTDFQCKNVLTIHHDYFSRESCSISSEPQSEQYDTASIQ